MYLCFKTMALYNFDDFLCFDMTLLDSKYVWIYGMIIFVLVFVCIASYVYILYYVTCFWLCLHVVGGWWFGWIEAHYFSLLYAS